MTPEAERELERIATLGYVAGIEPVPEDTGVLRHERDAASQGLTLFTRGKGPEAFLIDMEGEVVHSWSRQGSEYWARAQVFPNGDLLAITCFPPRLMKVDRNSDVVWQYEGHAHHDLDVRPDGSILVLVRSTATRSHLNGGEPVLDDNIVILDSMGRELDSISLLEAFEQAEVDWFASHPLPDAVDIFHTNSVESVTRGGRDQVLISIRSIDTVALLDLEARVIVWAVTGSWHKQHEAQFVGGNLLLFDNLGPDRGPHGAWRSRVLEIDAASGDVVWSYSAPGFFSHGAGAQQRLTNGNTLITESDSGRIIEVTPEKRVVWEYVNPETIEEAGREAILAIMRAERLPEDFPASWVSGRRR